MFQKEDSNIMRLGVALNALLQISNLSPEKDSEEGYNEWGEADCFGKAKKIALDAITTLKKIEEN